jgi:drug/metabolite transporter (DMT)-like permease
MTTAGTSIERRRSTRAVCALFGVTLLWGWTFVWMKEGVDAVEARLGGRGLVAGVGLFLALRFGIAAIVLFALPNVRRGLSARTWLGGAQIGAPLLAGFLLQMFGLHGVSPAVSAFLTSLYVLFTASVLALQTRNAPRKSLVVGALLATFGAGFIGGPPQLTFGVGEWLTVACAFVFAVHILVTDHVTKRHAPMPVTFTTVVWVALGSAVVTAIGLGVEGAPQVRALTSLCGELDFMTPVLLSSLLATVIAVSLMNTFQRDLDPVRAAIVYAIEPVWAALVSLALGHDHANGWLWIGGGALLAGNLIAELGPALAGARRRAAEQASARESAPVAERRL